MSIAILACVSVVILRYVTSETQTTSVISELRDLGVDLQVGYPPDDYLVRIGILGRYSALRARVPLLNVGAQKRTDAELILLKTALKKLGSLRGIKYLQLDSINLSDADVRELAWPSQLVGIELGENPITDSSVRFLVEHVRFENIALQGTRITDESLRILCHADTVRTIALSFQAHDKVLLQTLQHSNPHVRFLDWD